MILMPILIYPAILLMTGDAVSQLLIKKTNTPIEVTFIQIGNETTPLAEEFVELRSFIQNNLIHQEKEATPNKKINLEFTVTPIAVKNEPPLLTADDQIQLVFFPGKNTINKGEIQIFFNSENDLAFASKAKIQILIDDYNTILFKRILKEKNISLEMMQPITFRDAQNSVPTEHSAIKYGGSILAILLIFLTYISCQYAATEVIPAEREQLTLETLLATPLQWHEIIIGKYLAIVVAGFFNALLNLFGMLVFGGSIISSMANMSSESFQFHVPFLRIILILLSLIPLAFMCGAVSLFLMSFARTRMSASYFSVPGMLLVIAPAILTLMPNTQLQGLWIILPFANMTLFIRSLFLGDVSWLITLAIFVNVSIFSLAIAFFSISISNHKDKILSGGFNFTLFHKPKEVQSELTIYEGVFIFIVSAILFFTVGQYLQSFKDFRVIFLPLSFFVAFFLPSYIFMKYKNVNIIKFLNITMPTGKQFLGSFLFIIPLLVISQIFGILISKFLPEINQDKTVLKFIIDLNDKYGLFITLLLVAATPGIFEEFIMRGVLFHSIKKQLKPIMAIVLTGLIFAMYHGFLRMFPIIPIGIILTWLMYETKSIFVPMIIHTLFNGIQVYIALHFDESAIKPTDIPDYYYLIGLFIFIFLTYSSYILLKQPPNKNLNEI